MSFILGYIDKFNALLAIPTEKLQSLAQLGLRLYVSWIFFPSGLLKIKNWENTLDLFEYEYQVPILSPVLAAWMGTAGELFLPILLTLGLVTRFSALGLFVVNTMAVLSLEEIAPAAFTSHLLWGLAIGVIALWGSGYFSIDNLIKHKLHAKRHLL